MDHSKLSFAMVADLFGLCGPGLTKKEARVAKNSWSSPILFPSLTIYLTIQFIIEIYKFFYENLLGLERIFFYTRAA